MADNSASEWGTACVSNVINPAFTGDWSVDVADWEDACDQAWGPPEESTCRLRGGNGICYAGAAMEKRTVHRSGLGFRCCGGPVSDEPTTGLLY